MKQAFKKWDKETSIHTTFSGPEIASKQAWFEDLKLYDFNRTSQLIAHAFGVTEKEFKRVKPVYDRVRMRSVGADIIVSPLEALDELDASQSFKKMMVFSIKFFRLFL